MIAGIAIEILHDPGMAALLVHLDRSCPVFLLPMCLTSCIPFSGIRIPKAHTPLSFLRFLKARSMIISSNDRALSPVEPAEVDIPVVIWIAADVAGTDDIDKFDF